MEILRKNNRTLFELGTKFSYSNSGYAVLTLVVENLSAMTFAPQKTSDSLAHQEGVDVVRDRAYGHSKDGDKFKRTGQSLTWNCRWGQSKFSAPQKSPGEIRMSG